jgi:hypothetical protein
VEDAVDNGDRDDEVRRSLKAKRDLHLERMFETRSDAWERVGLAMNVSQRALRRAQRQTAVLLPLLIGVLVGTRPRPT